MIRKIVMEVKSILNRRSRVLLASQAYDHPQFEGERQRVNWEASYSEEDSVDYNHRIVVFIDVLGWEPLVNKSESSPELRQKLLNTAWFLGVQSRHDVEDDEPDNPSFDQVTQFSDSIVMSFPYDDYRDLIRMCRQVAAYQGVMLNNGILMRGGITVGPLLHQKTVVFGPAMNRAYRLECEVANHPRVILDARLSQDIDLARRRVPKHWPFLTEGNDGYWFLDYMGSTAKTKHLRDRLDKWVDRSMEEYRQDSNVRAKYIWLIQEWDACKARVDRGGSHR